MPTIRWSRRHRSLATLLLLPALAVRALVPAGFMPAEHAGVGIAMQLCTSQGLRTVIVPEDRTADPSTAGGHHDAPCAFAASAVAGPAPLAIAAVAVPAPARHEPGVERSPPPVRSPLAGAHSARGPPALA